MFYVIKYRNSLRQENKLELMAAAEKSMLPQDQYYSSKCHFNTVVEPPGWSMEILEGGK